MIEDNNVTTCKSCNIIIPIGQEYCSTCILNKRTLKDIPYEEIIEKATKDFDSCGQLVESGTLARVEKIDPNKKYDKCLNPKVPGYNMCALHLKEEIDEQRDSVGKLLHERGSVYGDIRDNTNCQYEFKKIYYTWLQEIHGYDDYDELNPESRGFTTKSAMIAHDECMEYVFEKIARMTTGHMHEDNYKDGIGYFELARKIAMGESTKV